MPFYERDDDSKGFSGFHIQGKDLRADRFSAQALWEDMNGVTMRYLNIWCGSRTWQFCGHRLSDQVLPQAVCLLATKRTRSQARRKADPRNDQSDKARATDKVELAS